jgi:hypothetical protein
MGIFHFAAAFRPKMGLTQPPTQYVSGALTSGVKWPGCEADHSPPSNSEVKKSWS